MKHKPTFQTIAASLLTAALMATSPLTSAENMSKQATGNVQSVQPGVTERALDKSREKRNEIISEAVAALAETKAALKALDAKKPDEAIAALERVTGKLDIILARDPSLALAPVDVAVATHDIYASADTIKKAVKQTEEYLDDGKVQEARAILANLASETIVSVTSIPLATYPDAIKAVVPLIDQGKIDEARAALETVLTTLVVEKHVIPLPIVRAKLMLKSAEALAENKERTEADDELLKSLIKDARNQLAMAEALGYGDKKAHKTLRSQLDKIESGIKSGKGGAGFFEKIRKTLSDLDSDDK